MDRKKRLNTKIRRLFRQAGHPRWVHHMGPKKFETWILCLGLVIRQVYRLSYRRAMKFLDEYFSIKMHWTTLQKAAKRLPKSFWQSLFSATLDEAPVELAAGDGTGFARSGPSNYYLRRIDRKDPIGRPVQLITLVDVKRRKFIAGHLSAYPKHEARKVPTLHRQVDSEIEVLLWDKAGDAEWLHAWLYENGTFFVAPVRKNCRRGMRRKVMKNCFDWCLYWQRNIVESLFSALKRLFGSSLSSKTIRTQNADMFCRLIAYNIGIKQYFFY